MLIATLRHALPPKRTPTLEPLVRVRGGYRPAVLHLPADEPLRICFLREETAPCSEQVVFPDFGKSTMLPTGERVVVELPPAEPGRYSFSCGMNMLHGTLVVEPRREPR